jgi:transcriptional regulator
MYCPPIFREERLAILHAFVRTHRLATLVTAGSAGLMANLLPFTLVMAGENGTLRAHLAKANEQVDSLREGSESLVIFQGPQTYITPSWYTSKAEHGKVVPTWNYAVVQARGTPRVIEDNDWLRAQIGDLTATQESSRATPWKVSDAPEDFVSAQLKAIIGIEISIKHIVGKWKVSQNRSPADRQSVCDGLRGEAVSDEMAQFVAQRGPVASSAEQISCPLNHNVDLRVEPPSEKDCDHSEPIRRNK